MNNKVVNIISGTNKAIAFEIIAKGLKKEPSIEISYILIQNEATAFSLFLEENNISYFTVKLINKKSYPSALISIYKILKKIKPNSVHTHLRDANLIGLTAAKLAGVKTRIHTRHHSTSNHEYYPKAVKWDKYINSISTSIVSISKNVTNVLMEKENVDNKKITLIHHGIDIQKFQYPNKDEVEKLKTKYQINSDNHPIIGVISRYIKLKGVQYIIPAFSEVKKLHPNAHLILANAVGKDSKEIKSLLGKHLNPTDFTEIPFENDLYSLYGIFDYFVHVPINDKVEAFGQTYIESLSAGKPAVFTISGIANEFIEHDKNALIVPYCSSKSISKELLKLINNNDLCKRLSIQGKKDTESFNDKKYINNHIELYNKLCHQKDKK